MTQCGVLVQPKPVFLYLRPPWIFVSLYCLLFIFPTYCFLSLSEVILIYFYPLLFFGITGIFLTMIPPIIYWQAFQRYFSPFETFVFVLLFWGLRSSFLLCLEIFRLPVWFEKFVIVFMAFSNECLQPIIIRTLKIAACHFWLLHMRHYIYRCNFRVWNNAWFFATVE